MQYIILILVFISIGFDIFMNYDYLSHTYKDQTNINKNDRFWRRLRDNFMIALLFTPSLMTFCCLREVAKENIQRYERSVGDTSVGTQFKKVID